MILYAFIYEQNISGPTYVPGGVRRLSILGSAVQVEIKKAICHKCGYASGKMSTMKIHMARHHT